MDNYSLFIIISRVLFYLFDDPLSHIILIVSYIIDAVYNGFKRKNFILCYNNLLTLIVLIFFGLNSEIKELIIWMELGTLIYHLFTPKNKLVSIFLMYYKIVGFHYKFANFLFQYTIPYLLFTLTNLVWVSNIWLKSGLVELIINNPVAYYGTNYKFYWKGLIMGFAHTVPLFLLQNSVSINSYVYIAIFVVGSLVTSILFDSTNSDNVLHRSSYGGIIVCGVYGFFEQGLLFLDKYCLAILIFETIKKLGCLSYGCCYGNLTGSIFYLKYNNKDSYVLMKNPAKKNVPIYPLSWVGLLMYSLISLMVYRQYVFFEWDMGILFGNTILIYSVLTFVYEYFRGKHIRMDNFITNISKVGIVIGCIIIAYVTSNKLIYTNNEKIMVNIGFDIVPLLVTFIGTTICYGFEK